ncbi:nuclear cap-binding protein subunit 3 isoform X2 [Nematostella vectensis]|uniref:nuclear cap-binding protein subunit 3 isoform X2 n=1 Tax=Nematostella vectensis TaxID=45351 RepID=UPI00207795EA|nr:nuclear cap-binding protein subunit 3 isoform X2 [Nematostella vectensis]
MTARIPDPSEKDLFLGSLCCLVLPLAPMVAGSKNQIKSKMEFEELKVEVPIDEDLEDETLPQLPEKRYENKGGSFVIGFDVDSKEAIEKRNRRAKRFGVQNAGQEIEDSKTEGTGPVRIPKDLPKIPTGDIRPDALLVFGVNEMSTKDVFEYFKVYGPGSIEWIDDASCNVVWDDEHTAKRALLEMSRKPEGEPDDKIIWRAGPPCDKAKDGLVMRFATKKDKKQPDAAKRSMYYLVHGYPGQQGKKGLVSKSRKRKILQEQERVRHKYSGEPDVQFVEEMELDEPEKMETDEPAIKVIVKNDRSTDKVKSDVPARLRMRMYADDIRGKDEGDGDDDEDDGDRDFKRDRKLRAADRLGAPEQEKEAVEKNDEKKEKEQQKKEDGTSDKAPSPKGIDLRAKLKSRRRHGFDFINRPSLSIEIREENS